MIEVIYDSNRKDKDSNEPAENDNNTQPDGKIQNSSMAFKLPKNIRQIGTPGGTKRIYIEDYVVTYLNYIARPGSTHARGAILLGEYKKTEIGDIVFISGAVDAQNLEFDMDESAFTQEAWAEIYDEVKEFFPELIVVGWFLSRMGFSTAINEKIEKMHVDNFPGKDKVLYITDSLESDDAFYMYEHGQLVKQRGYFIYYTKNEPMQNYIIKKKGGNADDENSEIKRKDEELIRNYRQKNNRTQGSKVGGINLVYVASSFVVVAMLAMGITVISNYDKMKEMEVSINRLELTAEDIFSDETVPVIATEDNNEENIASLIDADSAEQTNTEQTNMGQTGTENTDMIQNTEKNEDTTQKDIISYYTENEADNNVNVKTDDVTETMSAGGPTYYIIEYGDSLMSIALARYGSIEYAKEIAKANNMNIDDKIYEGQRIVLPTIFAE